MTLAGTSFGSLMQLSPSYLGSQLLKEAMTLRLIRRSSRICKSARRLDAVCFLAGVLSLTSGRMVRVPYFNPSDGGYRPLQNIAVFLVGLYGHGQSISYA